MRVWLAAEALEAATCIGRILAHLGIRRLLRSIVHAVIVRVNQVKRRVLHELVKLLGAVERVPDKLRRRVLHRALGYGGMLPDRAQDWI